MTTNKELVQKAVAAIPLWRAFLDQKEAEQDALLAEVRNEQPPESKPKQIIKGLTARFSRSQKDASDATAKLKAPREAPASPSEAENTAQDIKHPEPKKAPEAGHTAFTVQQPVPEAEKVTPTAVSEAEKVTHPPVSDSEKVTQPPLSEPEKVTQAQPEVEPQTPNEPDEYFDSDDDFDDDSDQFQDLFS